MSQQLCVMQGFPPESFEYILLDAPCSALGLRPRLTHDVTLAQLTQVILLEPAALLFFLTASLPSACCMATLLVDPAEAFLSHFNVTQCLYAQACLHCHRHESLLCV